MVRRVLSEALDDVDLAIDDDFFACGGDSLSAVVALAELEAFLGLDLRPEVVHSHPTPLALAAALHSGEAVMPPEAEAPSIAAPDPGADAVIPASPIQRGVLAAALDSSGRGVLAWVYQLNGVVDVPALSWAIDEVVARHPALRSRLEQRGDQLVQVFDAFRPGVLSVVEPEPGSCSLDDAWAAVEMEALAIDVTVDPRLRATLHRLGPKRSVLAIFVGEPVCDGETGVVVVTEISEAYARAREHRPAGPSVIAEPPVDTRGRSVAPELERAALEHWRSLAATEMDLGAWPTRMTGVEARHAVVISDEGWRDVLLAARRHRTTPYVVVLTAFETALARCAGAGDYLVTAIVHDQRRSSDAVGCFDSNVRIRATVEADGGFGRNVRSVADAVAEAVAMSVAPAPLAAPAFSTAPPPGVVFSMFESRGALDLVGLRQRRFRLGGSADALRLTCSADAKGERGLFLSSACASKDELVALGHAIEAALYADVSELVS